MNYFAIFAAATCMLCACGIFAGLAVTLAVTLYKCAKGALKLMTGGAK